MAFFTEGGRQYVVAGPWRHRSDIAEMIEVSPGSRQVELVRALEAALARRGVALLVVDHGPYASDPSFCDHLGLTVVERIIEYERPNLPVPPKRTALPIRSYQPADRDPVLEVERHSFPWLWWNSPEEWDHYLAGEGVQVLVGLLEQQVVGYAGFTVYRRDGYLDRLAVHKDFQGRGFGAALLVEALSAMVGAGARQIRLTTQEDNRRSRALYERHGFRPGRWVYEIYGNWLAQPEESHS